MYNTAFYIIIFILVLSFIISTYLNRLNDKNRNKDIPNELKDIYDNDKYCAINSGGELLFGEKIHAYLRYLSNNCW